MTTEEAIDNIVGFLLDEYDVDVVFDSDESGTYSPDARIIGIKDTDPKKSSCSSCYTKQDTQRSIATKENFPDSQRKKSLGWKAGTWHRH